MGLLKFVDTEMTPPLTRGGDGKGWYYIQKETMLDKPFRALGWKDLLRSVHQHRQAMTSKVILDVDAGWMDRLEDEMCREEMMDRECIDRTNPGPWRSELDRAGRKLWVELHAYAKQLPEELTAKDIEAAKKWLFEWESRIPNYSCACRNHYEERKKHNQPCFEAGDEFYRWSVRIHDSINQLLGKPAWGN